MQKSCTTNHAEAVTSPATAITNAKTFAAIPGTSVKLNGANNGTYCFIVHYSAEVMSAAPQTMRLRVTVDGVASGAPAWVDIATPSGTFEGRTFTFFVPVMGSSSGSTLVLQWLSVKGGAISVRKQSVVVSYFAT